MSATRHGLIVLRKKGLIGRDEFRSDRPTKSGRAIVKKYKDVIDGKATVVKPSSRLIPGRIRKALKERRGKLVVPKVEGTISTTVTQGGKIKRTRRTRFGKLIREVVTTPSIEIPPLPKGKVYRVTSTNARKRSPTFFDERAEFIGTSRYFASEKTLTEFLEFYDNHGVWSDIAITNLPQAFT